MKKVSFKIILLFLLHVSASHAGIDGSGHDLRPPHSKDLACIYCHPPYGDAGLNQRWTSETRSWIEQNGKKKKPLLKAARICLGCHDGNMAMDSLLNLPEVKRITIRSRRWKELDDSGFKVYGRSKFKEEARIIKVVNTDQVYDATDHPIGIRLSDSSYIDEGLYKEPINPSLRLFKGFIECFTCHSVHNTTAYSPFLVSSGTELCLSCHRK